MCIFKRLSQIAVLSLLSSTTMTATAIPNPGEPGCSPGTRIYHINRFLFYRHLDTDNGPARWVQLSLDNSNGQFPTQYIDIFVGDKGAIYHITPEGSLVFSQHAGYKFGESIWPVVGRKIGNGWENFVDVFAGEKGAIYAIKQNGDLLYYQHKVFGDGSSRWTVKAKKIGSGWSKFLHVFAGSEGAVYAIKENGDLIYYRHDGYDNGSAKWSIQAKKIGSGWTDNIYYWTVFAGQNGAIYGLANYGPLLYYKHDGYRDGSARWSVQGKPIESGYLSNNRFMAPVTSCP